MGPLQAFWAWRTGEQSMPNIWRSLDAMDDQEGGLIFSVQFDPMRAGFDPTLISFPVPSLISRLLGWSNNSGQGRPQGSVMVVAAAVALYVAVLFVSGQQPRRRRLAASAAARPTSAVRLRPRALPLPAPDSGLLRILSWNNVSRDPRLELPFRFLIVAIQPPLISCPCNLCWKREARSAGQGGGGRAGQGAVAGQLAPRVSVAAVETWILKLNALLLHEENERLKTQAAELEAVRAQLRRANEKLRALKERVQVERVESQREAAMLRDKVMDLELTGGRRERAFAAEAATLWKAKAGLEEENRELALRLQHAEQVSSSVTVSLVHEDDIVDEANYLREANDRLTRQIEQLRSDHCVHVEELVYLKWVNACLRHEIRGRDHHPSSAQQDQDGDGRAMTSAMDLSKSMSYRSSEKAKELMLRYGSLGLGGYDPALFSPLNETTDRDGKNHQLRFGDHDEPSRRPAMPPPAGAATPKNPAGHGKLKFLRNIKKLLASRRRSQCHNHKSEKKAMRWLSSSSHDALSGDSSYESTPLSSCQRTRLSSVTTVDLDARARGGEAAAEVPVASRPEADTQG
uniref:Protein CHUP1, chloroplastic n=1 Tax=Aegilops tauschii TaxID=37682 RepID=M8C788_AEGTA